MTDLHQKQAVLHQLQCLMDYVDEHWPNITHGQAENLRSSIEASWTTVCRRRSTRV